MAIRSPGAEELRDAKEGVEVWTISPLHPPRRCSTGRPCQDWPPAEPSLKNVSHSRDGPETRAVETLRRGLGDLRFHLAQEGVVERHVEGGRQVIFLFLQGRHELWSCSTVMRTQSETG